MNSAFLYFRTLIGQTGALNLSMCWEATLHKHMTASWRPQGRTQSHMNFYIYTSLITLSLSSTSSVQLKCCWWLSFYLNAAVFPRMPHQDGHKALFLLCCLLSEGFSSKQQLEGLRGQNRVCGTLSL